MPKWFSDCESVNSIVSINISRDYNSGAKTEKKKLSKELKKYINEIGDQQTLSMY